VTRHWVGTVRGIVQQRLGEAPATLAWAVTLPRGASPNRYLLCAVTCRPPGCCAGPRRSTQSSLTESKHPAAAPRADRPLAPSCPSTAPPPSPPSSPQARQQGSRARPARGGSCGRPRCSRIRKSRKFKGGGEARPSICWPRPPLRLPRPAAIPGLAPPCRLPRLRPPAPAPAACGPAAPRPARRRIGRAPVLGAQPLGPGGAKTEGQEEAPDTPTSKGRKIPSWSVDWNFVPVGEGREASGWCSAASPPRGDGRPCRPAAWCRAVVPAASRPPTIGGPRRPPWCRPAAPPRGRLGAASGALPSRARSAPGRPVAEGEVSATGRT
jgi:hypothetical protein